MEGGQKKNQESFMTAGVLGDRRRKGGVLGGGRSEKQKEKERGKGKPRGSYGQRTARE